MFNPVAPATGPSGGGRRGGGKKGKGGGGGAPGAGGGGGGKMGAIGGRENPTEHAMIVSCPKCQAKYKLEEKQFAGRPELNLRCTKCSTVFPAKAAAGAPAAKTPAGPPMPEATIVSKKGGALLLPADKRLALSVTQGPLKGKVFPFSKPRMVVGRTGADIAIEDPEVSRKHCAVEVKSDTALL